MMKLRGVRTSADMRNEMVSKMTILWILLILSPLQLHGIVVTDENLKDVLQTKFELPNDNTMSLEVLYGPKVTSKNFNPGPAMLRNIDSGEKVTFVDLFRFPADISTAPYNIMFTYLTPIYERIQNSKSKLMLIHGNALSGKTRALRIFETLLSSENGPENALGIYVNVEAVSKKNLFPNIPKNLIIDDIIRCGIKDEYVAFIKNIIEVNPSKIQFFFDNVDRLPAYKRQIMSAIAQLVSKDVGVVMTTSSDLTPELQSENLTPEISLLPNELLDHQISEFLTNYWSNKLSIKDTDPRYARITEYIKVLLLTIFNETPIDRSVGMIEIIAKNLMLEKAISQYPSVSTYVEKATLYNPKELIQSSHKLFVSKTFLYWLELSHLHTPLNVYGPQAVKLLFPEIDQRLNRIIKNYVQQSDQLIAQNGAELYPLMEFDNGKPVRFHHSDYKSYFAVSYIIKSFSTPNPLYYALEKLLFNPKHAYDLEFLNIPINSQQFDNAFRGVVTRKLDTAPHQIPIMLDHLIEHRFDYICRAVMKALDQNTLMPYLTDPTTILSAKKKYIFGMLVKPDTRDLENFPIKSPWQLSGTRQEMIVYLGLTEVLRSLEFRGYKPPENIQLIHAVRQDYHKFRAFIDRGDGSYPLELLDRAMYESLTALGINSANTLRDLRALGANAQRVNVNGRTLFHAAAKWHSRALLHLISDFGVQFVDSVDNSGKTALFELLDAGMPFNTYADQRAWRALEYLILKNADFSCNIQLIRRNTVDYLRYIPDLRQVPLALAKMMVYKARQNLEDADMVDSLKNYVPWTEVDVPREVEGMRRKLIIKRCIETMMRLDGPDARALVKANIRDSVTLSEILLLHRDIDTQQMNLENYQSSIARMIQLEAPHFNSYQTHRVFTLLAHQCKDRTEITSMITQLKRLGTKLSLFQVEKLKLLLVQRVASFQRLSDQVTGVDSFVVRTVHDLEHGMPNMDSMVDRIRQMALDNVVEGDENIAPEVASACRF